MGLIPLSHTPGQSQPSNQERHLNQMIKVRKQCFPSRGRGRSRQYQSCPFNAQASASYPILAPHNPILPMSSSATLWKISTYNQDNTNLGAGCGEMTPPPPLKRKQKGRNKSGLTWMRSLVKILHCPWLEPFPSGGHGQRVRWLSWPLYSHACGVPMANLRRSPA